MSKIKSALIFSFAFFTLASIVAYLLGFLSFSSPWIPLGIGVGLMIFAGAYEFISEYSLIMNIVCSVVNSVALGFCVRAWYTFREFNNGIVTMLLLALSCVVYMLLFCLPLFIPFIERHIKLHFWIFVVLSLAVYIWLLFTIKTTYLSTFGFYLIVNVLFIFAMCRDSRNIRSLVRKMTLSSSGVALVAVIIAVLMLDGDLDFLDIGEGLFDIDSPRKKKSKSTIK